MFKTGGPPENKGHTGHHDVHLIINKKAEMSILFHDTWTVTKEIRV